MIHTQITGKLVESEKLCKKIANYIFVFSTDSGVLGGPQTT